MKNKELISLYQSNPDKFIEDYLGVKLTWYQKAMMKTMDKMSMVYPKNTGRHNTYEIMQEVYKVLYGDKEE